MGATFKMYFTKSVIEIKILEKKKKVKLLL